MDFDAFAECLGNFVCYGVVKTIFEQAFPAKDCKPCIILLLFYKSCDMSCDLVMLRMLVSKRVHCCYDVRLYSVCCTLYTLTTYVPEQSCDLSRDQNYDYTCVFISSSQILYRSRSVRLSSSKATRC